MAQWLFYLSLLLLFAAAIYEHLQAATLSLPVSRALTITTILLPLLAAANAFFYNHTFRSPSSPPSTPRHLLATSLQALQALLVTVLVTLFSSSALPSAARACLLATTWQRLFSGHDAASIRRVQDALDCCGFNTVRDRAWPFPGQHSAHDCAETYGRDAACVGPWQRALQRQSGLELGIALAVGLLQMAAVFLVAANGSDIRIRRPFQRHAVTEPERARLLLGTGGSYGGVVSAEDAEQNGQTDTNNEPESRGETSHGNPWNSG